MRCSCPATTVLVGPALPKKVPVGDGLLCKNLWTGNQLLPSSCRGGCLQLPGQSLCVAVRCQVSVVPGRAASNRRSCGVNIMPEQSFSWHCGLLCFNWQWCPGKT